jgi:hypothetical protein
MSKNKQSVRWLPQLETVTENYIEKLLHTFSATTETVNTKRDEILYCNLIETRHTQPVVPNNNNFEDHFIHGH